MSDYIIYNGELYHYGVKGMRWRHRKSIYADAKNVYRRKKRSINDIYKKEAQKADKLERSKKISEVESARRVEKAADKWIADKKVAKAEYKQAKKNIAKSNVKKYQKTYDKASKLNDIADDKWSKANELYLKTGKNRVSRVINNIKGNSDAVKKYNKAYEDASRTNDKADELWDKAKKQYKKTGRSRAGRVINNIKYRK